jgi:HD-like signal output (HDOD) protein
MKLEEIIFGESLEEEPVSLEDIKGDIRVIEKVISKIPPIPSVFVTIMKLLRTDTHSPYRIAEEIAKDTVLAADVLKVVNSPLYGFQRRISSLEHAIVILGSRTISKLAIAAWAKRFQQIELRGYGHARGALAYQSMVGGYAARKVAESVALKFLEETIFTAAVVRNIGKVILDSFVKDKYRDIMKRVENGKPFNIAEAEAIGVDQAEIGYLLAEKWFFPKEISLTIKYFHNPSEYTGDERVEKIIISVHIADRVAMLVGEGSGRDNMLYIVDRNALGRIGIKEDDVERICVDTLLACDKIKEEFFSDVL